MQVIVTLVGPQDVDVAAHRPGTDGALIGVRVGSALVQLTDAATVTGFSRAWRTGGKHGRQLPVRADPSRIPPINGVALPAVSMEAGNCPPALARLEPGAPGRSARLWVMLGRMTFDVLDQEALVTTTAAFLQAARLASSVFLPTPDQRAVERTAAAAARLLAGPASRRPPRPGAPARTSSRPNAAQHTAARSAATSMSPEAGQGLAR